MLQRYRPPVVNELDYAAGPQHLVDQQKGQTVLMPFMCATEVYIVKDWSLLCWSFQEPLQCIAARECRFVISYLYARFEPKTYLQLSPSLCELPSTMILP